MQRTNYFLGAEDRKTDKRLIKNKRARERERKGMADFKFITLRNFYIQVYRLPSDKYLKAIKIFIFPKGFNYLRKEYNICHTRHIAYTRAFKMNIQTSSRNTCYFNCPNTNS